VTVSPYNAHAQCVSCYIEPSAQQHIFHHELFFALLLS
jgi:hypothetical protein